ncbi:hypothetical protein KSX_86800 [Ktedonospora formicarum]|uniref:Uncharacterized protein n=1 Tax=Ktedonospora formicarum TaxID=2778364 RepID=A0A8J3MVN6_9CHLR|nr:hypothetical protein KSX_86800 [Ktedonospora formicarum]
MEMFLSCVLMLRAQHVLVLAPLEVRHRIEQHLSSLTTTGKSCATQRAVRNASRFTKRPVIITD